MMIRRTPALLIGGLCLALTAPALAADLPSAEDIFAKHTAAIGGDALKSVRNVAAEFTFSMPQIGLNTTGKGYIEVPDKSYTVIDLAAVGASDHEDGVNGEVAWQKSPQTGLRLLEGIEKTLALTRARLDPYAEWQTFWESAETVAEEKVAGAPCYKVAMIPVDGEPVNVYFDEETGLIRQMDVPVPQMGGVVVVTPSDYREVDGVTMAHRIDQEGPMAIAIEYTSLRFNVDDIPADVFQIPQGVQEKIGK
jgi:hypothetical protein